MTAAPGAPHHVSAPSPLPRDVGGRQPFGGAGRVAGPPSLHELVSRTRVLEPGEVEDLLDVLGPEGFAWLRTGAGFVTAGVAARIPVETGRGRFERAAAVVAEVLRSISVDGPSPVTDSGPGAGPIAVGALPFDERAPGSLVVPAVVVVRRADGSGWVTTVGPAGAVHDPDPERIAPRNGGSFAPGPTGGTVRGAVNGHPALAPGSDVGVREDPGRAEWTESVRRILTAIDAGQVRKVVLARRLVVEKAGAPFDRRSVLDRLRRSHPSCFTYAAGGFVGASPELLVRRRGDEVASCPMAGTVRRGTTPEEDDALTAGLRRSVKEAEEHRLLVEAVVAALAPVCVEAPVAGEPDVVRFPTVSHLATRVSGVLRTPAPSALTLAGLLHPTPAVGGLPRSEALATISALEGFDRGLYAGPVGWVDAAGDGEWAVALRGAQLQGRLARLVAGAGIVAGSDPEAEWAETEVKLRPMLAAVGALRPAPA
ncbi:MAG: menaquinone-specific isochorismate synthase [Actinomycetota bacterium]|nr:menaquinone-specific isochorismate synthase [Actinomycetota bacterium]